MVKNILGSPLKPCCLNPITGFMRDGYCHTNALDQGSHLVCAIMTEEFLKFSQAQGNDLMTPRPDYQFPGLKTGDKWCLCALRWKEAYENNKAPPIDPEATHVKMLEIMPRHILENYYIQ